MSQLKHNVWSNTMELKIPEPICNKCNKLIEEGRPFCYECMSCIQCSPECFENEIDLFVRELSTAKGMPLDKNKNPVYLEKLSKQTGGNK